MSTRTPGPWTLAELKNGPIVHLCQIGEDALSILTVVDQDGTPFGAVYSEADARLIAAAPEMLSALQGVLRVADRQTDEFDAARAAIAKAIGGAK